MEQLQNLVQSEDEYFLFSERGLQEFAKNFDPKMPDKNVQWTTDYNVELPIRMSKTGPGAEPPVTITECFARCVSKYSKNVAMRVQRNKQWISWTYKQFYDESIDFANAMIANNITERKAINIIGFNSPEWAISYFGSLQGNYLPVGVYTTNLPDACHYVAENSDCEAVIVENVQHLKKYLQIWDKLPKLKLIVIYDDQLPSDIIPENKKNKVFLWQNFLQIGKKFKPTVENQKISRRLANQSPGTACTLIYTSGTTGNPKGVICSHDNFTWVALQFIKQYQFSDTDRLVSYLPLSHIAAQMLDLVSLVFVGHSLHFALPTALQGTLVETLKEVKPTVFLAVPRVYEKIEEKMKFMGSQGSALKQKIGTWAKSLGVEGTFKEVHKQDPGFQFNLAKKVIYSNVKKALGLDQARLLIFGAAPMGPATRQYFLSLNMLLINIFGMSETAAVQIICEPDKYDKFDLHYFKSCGQNYAGTKMMIFQPDKDGNGEICFKGRNRFMGYYKNEQATRETIDPQGYLHSGDVGKLDPKKNISITGRIKELIITAGGENVAPILIENQIKEEIKIISQAMVIGDNRKYLIVLLTLKQDEKQRLPIEVKTFLQTIGSQAQTVAEAQKCPKISQYISDGIKVANSKAISRAQTVRKWAILNTDFTEEGGEMTPTMKLKRVPTQKKYIEIIEKLYQDPNL